MTLPFLMRLPVVGVRLLRSALPLTILCAIAVAGPARAVEGWQGSYHSNLQNRDIAVWLTLPVASTLGELRFETLSCSVGLQPTSGGSSGSTVYTIEPWGDSAGPYCGNFLGGRVETRPLEGDRRMEMSVTKRNSTIRLIVTPIARD